MLELKKVSRPGQMRAHICLPCYQNCWPNCWPSWIIGIPDL